MKFMIIISVFISTLAMADEASVQLDCLDGQTVKGATCPARMASPISLTSITSSSSQSETQTTKGADKN